MLLLRRIRWSWKKHGLIGLVRRASVQLWRALFGRTEILMTLDAATIPGEYGELPASLEITRCERMDEIPPDLLEELAVERGGMDLLLAELAGRFEMGGGGECLWLSRSEGRLGAVIWTVRGGYDGFYLVPMSWRDVVFVAGHTFPDHRGKGLYKTLLRFAAWTLKEEGVTRFHGGVYTWNRESVRGLSRVGFEPLAKVRETRIFGVRLVRFREIPPGERTVPVPSVEGARIAPRGLADPDPSVTKETRT